jgi:glycosyltransferase involved in cell wall biosynthesis
VLIGIDAVALTGARAGVARYVHDMLSAMLVESPDVEFILYSPTPIQLDLPRGRWSVRSSSQSHRFLRNSWLGRALPRMVADDAVDVFWAQNQMMPTKWLRPCRRVLTVHDMGGDVCSRSMRLRHRLSWRLNMGAAVRAADRIVADSHATARLLCRFLGVPTSLVTIVYPGRALDLRPISRAVARQQVAARFGLPDDFILTVGTLEPRKDHATLLDAVKRRSDIPLLVIVGETGWKSRTIMREVREAEGLGRARHVGKVSDCDLAALYGAARLMVYPSFYEGFGLPVVEAMMCGCPVLCGWSSSMPEAGGAAVAYFRSLEVDDLAIRLASLLGDSGRLAQMSVLGLEQSARFSYRHAARQLLSVLRGGAQR